MWRVTEGVHESSRSAVLMDGNKSEVLHSKGCPKDVAYL